MKVGAKLESNLLLEAFHVALDKVFEWSFHTRIVARGPSASSRLQNADGLVQEWCAAPIRIDCQPR
jgi:hypothetical protein